MANKANKEKVEAAIDRLIENLRNNEAVAPYLDESRSNMPAVMRRLALDRFESIMQDTKSIWNFEIDGIKENLEVNPERLGEAKEYSLNVVGNEIKRLENREISGNENIHDTLKSLAELVAMKEAEPVCKEVLENNAVNELLGVDSAKGMSTQNQILLDLVSDLRKDPDLSEEMTLDNIGMMKEMFGLEYNKTMEDATNLKDRDAATIFTNQKIKTLENDLELMSNMDKSGSFEMSDNLDKLINHAELAAKKGALKDYLKLTENQQKAPDKSQRSSRRFSRGEKKESPQNKRRSRSWSREKKGPEQKKQRRSRSGSLKNFMKKGIEQIKERRLSSSKIKIDDSAAKPRAPTK